MKVFRSIQSLRAVAALMVVAFHLFSPAPGIIYPKMRMEWGAAGVDIFFVISGFIIYVSQVGERRGAPEFLFRRLMRIAPLYWVFTLMLVALHMAIRLNPTLVLTPAHVLLSLLFIPHFAPGVAGQVEPVLLQGWTLNYEIAFYALFALATALAPQRRVVLVGTVLLPLVAVGLLLKPGGALGLTYTNARLLEFFCGMLIGVAARSAPHRLPGWLGIGVPLGLAALAATEALAGPRVLFWMPLSVAIVAGAVALDISGRAPRLPLLLLLGDASYSIYLSHSITQSFFREVWRRVVPLSTEPVVFAAYVASGLVVSGLIGVGVYWFCERPLSAVLKRPWGGALIRGLQKRGGAGLAQSTAENAPRGPAELALEREAWPAVAGGQESVARVAREPT